MVDAARADRRNKIDGPSLGDVVSAAALGLGLVTAWNYFAGWSYAYHFFDRFRIPLLMVDVPAEHVFVYGGLVIWKNWYWSVLIAIGILALSWICKRYAAMLGRFGLSAIVVALVVVLFALARLGGVTTARHDYLVERSNDYASYPRVQFALNKELLHLESNIVADLAASDCGRLLLYTEDRLFLIRPVQKHPLELDTFVLHWDKIDAFRITSTYESCP